MNIKLFIFSALSSLLAAQAPPVDTTEQDLLALLNTPLTVASAKGATLRESPGVISVITQEEIAAIGARNIDDVLRLVPGFQFGYDVEGSVGLMARSFWVYEGKVLILWNNIDMTELLYGTTSLGDRFPIDQIKRIEIIRGPGSAIYGGSAELVVIKIISMDGDDVDGVAGSAGYRYAKGFNAKEAGAMAAGHAGGFNYTVGVENTKDPLNSGDTFGYFNLTSDRLTLNFLAENMIKGDPDGPQVSDITSTQWLSQNLVLKYKVLKDPDGLTLTPYIKYTKSIPWVTSESDGDYTRFEVARFQFGFEGLYATGPWGLGFGFNNYNDHAAVSPQTNYAVPLTYAGATQASQEDSSAYVEGTYTGFLNVTAGGRYDHNSVSGDKFVPRLALTKTWASWYAKVLFAEAFRTPDVLNFGEPATLGAQVAPETTRTYELEVGNQFGASVGSANIYWSRLEQPLVWLYSGSGGYVNGPDVTGMGLELSYKYKATWGFMNLGYAHALTDNNVAAWSLPGDPHTAVDAAKDQLTALVSVKLSTKAIVSANATYLGKRFAYNPDGTIQPYSANTLLNANLTLNLHPFTIMVGAYDLLDKKVGILPGYQDGTEGLEGQGLEGFLKLKYGF